MEKDDLIELRHARLVAEDELPERLAPQTPVRVERGRECGLQLPPQVCPLFRGQKLVIQRVAVDPDAAARLDAAQKRRLAAAGAAGNA